MKPIRHVLPILTLLLAPTLHADEVRDACSALVVSYAQHRDNIDADAFANLFTEDGVLIIGENHWDGRDEIRARIEAMDESHATGVSYVVIYSAPPGSIDISGPALIGDYIF